MKKVLSRRRFLGFLSTAPVAAKRAAEDAAAKLADLSIGVSRDHGISVGTGSLAAEGPDAPETMQSKIQFMRKWFGGGIPDWIKEEKRRECTRNVTYIHPNIGGLRSVSLQAKFQMQARRNYEDALDDIHDKIYGGWGYRVDRERELSDKFGVYL